MNARRTAGAAARAPTSADHQKLDTYASTPRAARWLATARPVSRAAASLPAHFISTFTTTRPRHAARTSCCAVKFPQFDMERMQSVWEHKVKYDLSESGVEPLTLEEAARDPRELLKTKLGYAEGVGIESTRQYISEFHWKSTADGVDADALGV